MLVLSFEEFPNVFDNKNEAMSNFDIERIGCDLTLIPIEVVMRSQITESIIEDNVNFIVNLHPTDGTC